MMIQLKKPFNIRFTPLVQMVRSLLQTVHYRVKQRQQHHRLTANRSSLASTPVIEISAVPIATVEPAIELCPQHEAIELPELISIHPPTPTAPAPAPETPAVIPPIDGDIEPEPGKAEISQPAIAPLRDSATGDRSLLVVKLLDEATAQGISTYPQLMAYVKDKTGTSCSRRTIANWKKARTNENLSSN